MSRVGSGNRAEPEAAGRGTVEGVEGSDGEPGSGRRRRSRRRRLRAAVGAASAVLVVAVGVVAALGFGGAGEPPAGRSNLPPATAKVTKQTLTETETVDGTLGYGDAVTVAARGESGVMLTGMPAEGEVIKRGKALYKVDNKPVVLLYGSIPLYRTLAPGVDGWDVKLLENNLSKLGYDGFHVDDEYTDATADAVRDWQDDLGLDETGTVTSAQVVVASGPIRVAETKKREGDLASGPVLVYTGTTRIVTVDLDVAKQELVRKGVAATVELPNGKQVAGKVERVGTVATQAPGGGADQQETTTTIEVTVSLKDQKALGRLDQAPVDVVLRADQREDVLTVPVNALVAQAEGGYGVQVVEGSTTRFVPVETGMFAEGRVEVSGDGLAEGITVGVPK